MEKVVLACSVLSALIMLAFGGHWIHWSVKWVIVVLILQWSLRDYYRKFNRLWFEVGSEHTGMVWELGDDEPPVHIIMKGGEEFKIDARLLVKVEYEEEG